MPIWRGTRHSQACAGTPPARSCRTCMSCEGAQRQRSRPAESSMKPSSSIRSAPNTRDKCFPPRCPHTLPLVAVLVYIGLLTYSVISLFIVRCSSTLQLYLGVSSRWGTAPCAVRCPQDTESVAHDTGWSTSYPQPLHHYSVRACIVHTRVPYTPQRTHIHTYTMPYAPPARQSARILHNVLHMAWVRPRGSLERGERGGARASARMLVVDRGGIG